MRQMVHPVGGYKVLNLIGSQVVHQLLIKLVEACFCKHKEKPVKRQGLFGNPGMISYKVSYYVENLVRK